jgi:hypothetical protein
MRFDMAYRHITKEEESFIIANDSNMSVRELCEVLRRSKGTIDKTRKRLGLRKDFHTPWSQEELDVLHSNPTLSTSELAKLFPDRTLSSVVSARKYNGLRMVRSCFMCEQSFTAKESNTKVCGNCNPSGKRDNKNPIVRYAHYKEGADARRLSFELTGPEFWSFWQKPCTYCGSDIETIGLDRIDPSKGYIMENVTPCCSRCNEMKMADDTVTWVSHMKKILQHMEKNNG